MATAATSLLGLALPVTGELSGTWGDTVNVSITALLDTAVAGTTTLSSDADVTLTTTTLAANQARQAIILWTAGGTVTRTITVPAQSKSYIVINKTSSSQSIKIVGVGPTTGVTIVAGTAAFVVWNGVDFVTASVTSTTGVLPVANGGTGLASGTSGGVLAYTAAGTLASSTALAASALVIGGGAGAAPSTTTTGTGVVTALGVNTGTAGAFVVNGGALGTPSSGTLTSATGLPISTGVSGLGSNVATFLATPSSANLAAAVTDETGSGALVFGTSPTFTTSVIGDATMAVFNTASTTVNAFGAATALNIGAATGTLTVANTTLAAKAITVSTTLAVTGITTLSDDLVVNNAGGVATFNSTNSNSIKIILQDAGVAVGYIGATGTGSFLADSGAVTRVLTTTSGAQVTGTLSATGDITSTTGNLIVGTAGKGIDFSATSSGSGTMTSELLADYEEGTWIPIPAPGASGTITSYTSAGSYTKIGRQVLLEMNINITNAGTALGGMDFSGIPFVPSSSVSSNNYGFGVNTTTGAEVAIRIYNPGPNPSVAINIVTGLNFSGSISYTV